ncbi:sulfite exporter TauE/SafE family protein [Aliikangiella maris]|uniref:Sulfite exporter TauE/SafE family protein n=2 Tax=Aliikangiella maris TaxID=3162458 RepID=A0ABV2BSH1_9GAMM
MLEIIIIFVLAGLAAGFLAGLLGIGGGFVIVPVLIWALPLAGISQAQVIHCAIGTSLLCICVTAISSTRAHHARQSVKWSILPLIIPGLITGSLIGSTTAAYLNDTALVSIFVAGAFATGGYLLSGHSPQQHPKPSRWPEMLYGTFTGTASTLMGIGGGSLLVPFLIYRGNKVVESVGTAAACGIPIALFGATGYAIAGWSEQSVDYAIGYLYWPAFLGIVLFSSLSAPLGAKVAHRISPIYLRRLFAGFLFLTGLQLIYGHWF